jgi:hypothetical protein
MFRGRPRHAACGLIAGAVLSTASTGTPSAPAASSSLSFLIGLLIVFSVTGAATRVPPRHPVPCRLLGTHLSHLATGLGASPTEFRAALHRFVLAKSIAIGRAGLAEFGADLACSRVVRRAEQHEARTGVANLRAR